MFTPATRTTCGRSVFSRVPWQPNCRMIGSNRGKLRIGGMRVFLDFEASSLRDDSYPIEVGWVFEDGRSEAHLIRPAPKWIDWDESAEALHGISRAKLEAEGASHDAVAHRLLEALGDHIVYASAPSWDGKWLSVLLRGAGLPRHAMRLKDSDEAHLEAALEILRPVIAEARLKGLIGDIMERAREAAGTEPTHRALEDAEREWRIWLAVRRIAAEEAGNGGSGERREL